MTKKNDIIGLWRFTYKALVNVAKSHRNIKTSFDAYDVITKKMSMRHDFDLEDSVAVIIVSNVPIDTFLSIISHSAFLHHS